jgi:hypothetical protein
VFEFASEELGYDNGRTAFGRVFERQEQVGFTNTYISLHVLRHIMTITTTFPLHVQRS